MKKRISNTMIILHLFLCISCEEHLTKVPHSMVWDESVIVDGPSATRALMGMYSSLAGYNQYGNLLILIPGVLSDELAVSVKNIATASYYKNQVLPTDNLILKIWASQYQGIYIANTILERTETINIDHESKNRLRGEAIFGRALMHFNLLNLFGGVPLATTTDLETLRTISRSDISECFEFVIGELKEATDLLSGIGYGSPQYERYRANVWTVKALLARASLYWGETISAGAYADEVIRSGEFDLERSNYMDIFSGSSIETIFQILPEKTGVISIGNYLRPEGSNLFSPSPKLVSAIGTEGPRSAIVERIGAKSHQTKYTDTQIGLDHIIVLRLAEMYLIRAEANLGTQQAEDDLNVIRVRAGLPIKTNITKEDILQERFVELAFEGHRWFDLVRTGKVDEVMKKLKPNTWSSTDTLLPIPQYELDQNPWLGEQNPGY